MLTKGGRTTSNWLQPGTDENQIRMSCLNRNLVGQPGYVLHLKKKFHLLSKKVVKMPPKNDFDHVMACEAPICWSKYNTVTLQKKTTIVVYGKWKGDLFSRQSFEF